VVEQTVVVVRVVLVMEHLVAVVLLEMERMVIGVLVAKVL
tara:strand:- start:355 stop:474 length:120 start_codon:yes stop_codon:yes gene_type:complete